LPESSLSLQLSDLAAEVGSYMGFGRTAANWTGWVVATPYVPSSLDTQLGQIMSCINSGLRQFYNPPIVERAPVAHKWSFLSPQRTLTTLANDGEYDLPDDYGGMQGEMTYQPSVGTYLTLRRVGVGELQRALQGLMSTTGKPTMFAVLPKQSDGAMGQRFYASLAPIPDGVYVLTYTMTLLPQALTSQRPFPLGGEVHGETILASCLAVAEQRFQDEEKGNHWTRFMERLQASITADVRDAKPANLGYNGDRSDYRDMGYPYGWPDRTSAVTYNGTVP
jgi:hypothetical protein